MKADLGHIRKAKLRRKGVSFAVSAVLPVVLLGSSPAAQAVDGCQLLLCLAGNWRGIPLCVPTVKQAFRDLARGRPFPTCSMAGSSNTASHSWASEATCPPFYSYVNETGGWGGCTYPGVISVMMNGVPWSDVYWSFDGATATRYYGPSRAALGDSIDPTYDRDAAAYVPPAPSGGDSGGF